MAGSVIRTFFGQSLGLQGLGGYAPLLWKSIPIEESIWMIPSLHVWSLTCRLGPFFFRKPRSLQLLPEGWSHMNSVRTHMPSGTPPGVTLLLLRTISLAAKRE